MPQSCSLFYFLYSFAFLLLPIHLFGFSSSSLFEPAKKEEPKTSRISILPFANSSNFAKYNYLSASISSTIKLYFGKMFEYEKVDQSKVSKVLLKILKTTNRKWYQMEKTHIEKLAIQNKLDVVIYGKYQQIKSKKKKKGRKKKKKIDRIRITTILFFTFNRKHIALTTSTTQVSGRLMSAFNKIAKSSVKKIKEILYANSSLIPETDTKSPILFVHTSETTEIQEKIELEIEYIKSQLEQKYDGEIISLEIYLEYNPNVSPPKEKNGLIKKKTLKKWSKKNKFTNVMQVKVKSGLVKINLILKGRKNQTIEYDIETSDEIKDSLINNVVQTFDAKKTSKIRFVLAKENSFENYYWKDVSSEIGLNPFYHISLVNNLTSLQGGGFTFYARTPLNSANLFMNKLFKTNLKIPSWLSHYFFIGSALNGTYLFESKQTTLETSGVLSGNQVQINTTGFFQHYALAIELSYLHLITNFWRIGFTLRPSFYFGFVSRKIEPFIESVSINSGNYWGFVLPIVLEANYRIGNSYSLNMGVSDSLFFEGTVSHSLAFFLGVSFLIR